ncbi:MAG TPA: hypothetical protein ENF82_01830 [Candidatus Methanomethylia archaeon]|nr:hypothetical protein [Candidatus Methanomethylicia archaeon]
MFATASGLLNHGDKAYRIERAITARHEKHIELGKARLESLKNSLSNVVFERLRANDNRFFSALQEGFDKIARAGVEAVPAKKIKAPVIREAAVVIECKVLKEVEAGDHIMVVGEVIEAYRSGVEGPLLLWHRGSVTKLK